MLQHQLVKGVVHHGIDDIGRQGGHIVGGTYDPQVQLFAGTRFYQDHIPGGAVGIAPDEIGGYGLDGGQRRGKTYPGEIGFAVMPQTLQGEREECTPLGIADVVDLVQDQPLDTVQLLLELGRLKDQCQGLGGGDEDVGWVLEHLLTLVLGRVTGTYPHPDVRNLHTVTFRDLPHLCERRIEVPVDVIGQCLQRGDVDAVHPLLEGTLVSITGQFIDDAHECGQSLSGSSG